VTGRTEHYRSFLDTWAPHCGAKPAVFKGQFDVTLGAELEAALAQIGAGKLPALVRAVSALADVARFPGAASGSMDPNEEWVQVPALELRLLDEALGAYEDALRQPGGDHGSPHG
jgi:hypothetical protein